MNAKIITVLILIALLTGRTTGEPPSSISPRSDVPADRKTPGGGAHDTNGASPNGLDKAREAEIRREITLAIERRGEADERHDVAALEKLLADEFTVLNAGQIQTKSNALARFRTLQAEGWVFEDVKIRVDERSPVVTFRSVSRHKAETHKGVIETVTFEILSSLEFRHCNVEEERRGYEKWLVKSAIHMTVHLMPSNYWRGKIHGNPNHEQAA